MKFLSGKIDLRFEYDFKLYILSKDEGNDVLIKNLGILILTVKWE